MRIVQTLNDGWTFFRSKRPVNGEGTPVTLPHTWSSNEDGCRDVCCYTRELPKPDLSDGQRVWLEINGAAMTAKVYLNGKKLARHEGGYSTFRVDLTDDLQESNLLTISVDNRDSQTVYPQKADFTFYGGLYRDVKLITVPSVHFELGYCGTPGIKITPVVNLEEHTAKVKVETWIRGDAKQVIFTAADQQQTAFVSKHFASAVFTIPDAHLWDGVNDPYLYTASAKLDSGDEVSARFGCRQFEIDPQKGFLLNGRPYRLYGASRHQDWANIGNALTIEHHKEDMAIIRELGATSMRLAHYQHAQEFYDLCDENGIIVWAEIPYITMHMKNGRANTLAQMEELIIQNYNHPCVAVWGLSNEITAASAVNEDLLENHRVLNHLCHRLDLTRPTTMASVYTLDTDSPLLNIPDVNSYNLYFGWYLGETKQVDEYEEMSSAVCRMQYLDKYQGRIMGWLQEYPDMTAAQVCDWLKEHYREEISERTVSRYVKQLREEYGLKKSMAPREYEAVPELPMGQQMQVDFGQKMMPNVDGGQTKVYVAAFVLSRSRHKYAQEQSRPFTSVDLVRICHDCFRYMGGMPEELVFDQDSIVCVSENAGDIIYTYEFEKFRQECGLSIRMCRGADPESKGKIENVVKYIKGNFLSHRLYVDDGILNGSCLEWLERTANAKVHGTTKLIPAEMFQEEREYLRPLPVCDQAKRPVICRTVRKDNTIIYDSNRYSVPLGTYTTQPEVRIETLDGTLYIQTLFGEPICEHRISSGRGLLIQSQSHRRDRTSKLDELLEELDAELGGGATEFLTAIRVDKSRYARDQFRLIHSLLDQYGMEAALQAIGFCQRSRLYSANTMRDYLEHQAALSSQTRPAPAIPAIPVDDPKYHVTTQKRPLADYVKVGGPGC